MKAIFVWFLLTVGLGGGFCHADCQLDLFAECSHRAKEFSERNPEGGSKTICDANQVMITCFSSPCEGRLIDAMRFLVLQNMFIEKKIACPKMDYQLSTQLVQDMRGLARELNVQSIEYEDMNGCFKKAYLKCNKQFGDALKASHNFCRIMEGGVTCFEGEAPGCPNNLVFQRFLNILETLEDHVAKVAEQHGNICNQ